METGFLRSDREDTPMPNNTEYRQAIRALLYVTTIRRAEILVAVNISSRKNESPSEKDKKGVKRLGLNLVISTEQPHILKTYSV